MLFPAATLRAAGAIALLCGWAPPAHAQVVLQPPAAAAPYRQMLVRQARLVMGLDAPVALLAAQVHQESGWNPRAVSRVGAQGLAQFMPATARWWCGLGGMSGADCQPHNPAWALRALAGYDLWLHARLGAAGAEPERWWATLRSYNGGLGHWQAEAAKAGRFDRAAVDAACGTARRHIAHCAENLQYPHRIMQVLQPRYSSWGPSVPAPQINGSPGARP